MPRSKEMRKKTDPMKGNRLCDRKLFKAPHFAIFASTRLTDDGRVNKTICSGSQKKRLSWDASFPSLSLRSDEKLATARVKFLLNFSATLSWSTKRSTNSSRKSFFFFFSSRLSRNREQKRSKSFMLMLGNVLIMLRTNTNTTHTEALMLVTPYSCCMLINLTALRPSRSRDNRAIIELELLHRKKNLL